MGRDLRKTFESLDNEEDGSSVQRITRSSVNSDTNRRSRQLSSRSSRASGDSVEDILADLDSIQYAMQQDDGVKDIVEIANDEFDEDDISNDEGLGKSHVKVAYPNVIVSYSSQDLRIISKSGQLVSRLEPSSIIEGVKAYTVSLFQEMLFCLMEKEGSNVVKIYDISNQKCPLLKTKLLSVSEVDMCTCMCMCNVLPSKASQATRPVGTKDFRGN